MRSVWVAAAAALLTVTVSCRTAAPSPSTPPPQLSSPTEPPGLVLLDIPTSQFGASLGSVTVDVFHPVRLEGFTGAKMVCSRQDGLVVSVRDAKIGDAVMSFDLTVPSFTAAAPSPATVTVTVAGAAPAAGQVSVEVLADATAGLARTAPGATVPFGVLQWACPAS